MKGVYAIQDNNGKMYIGSSKDIDKRFLMHIRGLRKGKHHNIVLQRTYDKYGEDFFKFIVLEETDLLFEREQYYIDATPNRYNIGAVGGGDNISNHPRNAEIRARSSVRAKKEYQTGVRVSQHRFGADNPNWRGGPKYHCACGATIQATATGCAACRDRSGSKNSFFGKTHSDELKENHRQRMLGNVPPNRRKIRVEGVEYESLSAFSVASGVSAPLTIYRIKSPKWDYCYVD